MLNLSFALDYAGGGLAVGRYHVTNILIHVATGLLLSGAALRAAGRNEVARLNPLFPLARYKYGDALARADRLDAATAELEAVLAIDPLFADAYLTLATIQLRRGDVVRAQTFFARGAALRAQEPGLFVNWGNVLLTQGHPHEATTVLRQAVERAPRASFAHYRFGLALTGEQQFESAVREFKTAVHLDPEYAEAHNNLGLARARLGRIRAALPHFEAAVRLAPDLASARANLDRARSAFVPAMSLRGPDFGAAIRA